MYIYEWVSLAGDFNVQVGAKSFDTFLYQYELISINLFPRVTKTQITLVA